MIKRIIYKELLNWKNKEDRKPLIIRGARQVGKTTLIRMFSSEFEQYIELNLDKKEDLELFERKLSFEDLIKAIFLHKNLTQKKRTLIFIDEIQNSKEAIKQLRYFYEERKDLYVLAAGSLLENLINKSITFPVGRVEYLYMYPLCFYEFLNAKYPEILDIYNNIPFESFAHQKFLKIFNEYSIIGGMPEVVKNYLDNNDIVELNNIYNSLIIGYKDDIEKYERNERKKRLLRFVIDNIFREAGNRIKFSKFGKSKYKSVDISESFTILEKVFLIKLLYPTTGFQVPAIPDLRKSPKLMLLDNGLVNFVSGFQKSLIGEYDILKIAGGKLAEQIVYQELRLIMNHYFSDVLFWVREKKQSNAEVDFVFPFKNMLIPVEVKSAGTGRLRSLHQFINRAPHNIGVRIYSGEFSIERTKTVEGKDFFLLNLPIYLTSKLPEYLEYLISKI